jgi:hypothetical protein
MFEPTTDDLGESYDYPEWADEDARIEAVCNLERDEHRCGCRFLDECPVVQDRYPNAWLAGAAR